MAMGTAGRKNEDGSGQTVVVSCVEVNTAVFPVLSTVNSESAPLGSLVVTSDADPSWVNRKNENSRVSVRLELRSDAAGGHFIEGPFLPSGGATFFIAGAIDKVNGTVTATADSLIAAPAGVSGDGTLVRSGLWRVGAGPGALTL